MPTGISLHVGVNDIDSQHYQGEFAPLRSAENDARDMAQIATQVFKYSQSSILLGKFAKCKKVLQHIKEAAKQLEAGDIFLLTYSGHGSQIPNEFYRSGSDDEENDQTLCLYDRMLIDDELYEAFGAFKEGVRVCMIADCCHSGTNAKIFSRDDLSNEAKLEQYMLKHNLRSKLYNDLDARETYIEYHPIYKTICKRLKTSNIQEPKANVQLFAACQDEQVTFDGIDNGVFTKALKEIITLEQWKSLSSLDLIKKLEKAYDYPKPNYLIYGGSIIAANTLFPMVIDENYQQMGRIEKNPPSRRDTSNINLSEEYVSSPISVPNEWVIEVSWKEVKLSESDLINLTPFAPTSIEMEVKDKTCQLSFSSKEIKNIWDIINAIHQNATEADYSLRIEPIETQQFPIQEDVAPDKASGSGTDHMVYWPPGPMKNYDLGWHLRDSHSQLESARNHVWTQIERNELDGQIRIAHIDTGYAPEHPALKNNRFIQRDLAKSFLKDEEDNKALDEDTGKGQQWHGTGTLTILAGRKIPKDDIIPKEIELFGAIPFAEVIPLRIADSVIIFNAKSFSKAVDYAIENGCEVITMSMGGKPSNRMAKAINKAYENGITIVTAAGNCIVEGIKKIGPRSLVFPARFDRVIAACGACYNHLPYDFKAQAKYGFGVKSSLRWMQGNWGPSKYMSSSLAAYTPNILWAEHSKETDKYLVKKNGGGTSSATPQIAAAAALWIVQHRKTLEEKGYRGTWKQVEALRHALFTAAHKDAFKNYESDYHNYNTRYYGNGILRAKDALDIGVVDVQEPQKARKASVFGWGITATLKLLILRNQKGNSTIRIPNQNLLEQELQHHILSNGRYQELVEIIDKTGSEKALEELIGFLKTSLLSKELRKWID